MSEPSEDYWAYIAGWDAAKFKLDLEWGAYLFEDYQDGRQAYFDAQDRGELAKPHMAWGHP